MFAYLDGESVNLTPVFDVQDLSPEVWFDASDLDADNTTDTTPSGNISAWMDKSLNNRGATSVGTPYLNTSAGPNNGRAIEIRSGDYLPIDGTFFAKDYFFVFRSPRLIRYGVDMVAPWDITLPVVTTSETQIISPITTQPIFTAINTLQRSLKMEPH